MSGRVRKPNPPLPQKIAYMRATVLATALVLLSGVGPQGIAASGSDAKIKAAQFTVGSFDHNEGYARCGKGKRAVGGGVVQSGLTTLQVHASGPLDRSGVTLDTDTGDIAKQWYAAVVNGSDTERIFRVFAICSAVSKATIVATEFTTGSFDHGEGYARCGKGKRALGGGVVQSGLPNSHVVEASGPLDGSGSALNTESGDKPKQWYGAVFSYDNGGIFRVFAICSAESRATIKASLFLVDGNEATGEGYARCGKGKRALGGGVVPLGSADHIGVRASGPLDRSGVTLDTDTGDIAKQWYAAALNRESFQRVIRVFAICA